MGGPPTRSTGSSPAPASTSATAASRLCQRAIDENPPPSVRTWDELSDDALLAEMVRIHTGRRQVDDAVAQVVGRLRARRVTWARIGEALGMTRQSAWERFSGED